MLASANKIQKSLKDAVDILYNLYWKINKNLYHQYLYRYVYT